MICHSSVTIINECSKYRFLIVVPGDVFKLSGSVESHLWVWSLMPKIAVFERVEKKVEKSDVLIWKIQYYGFVGNVYADLGLPWFSY